MAGRVGNVWRYDVGSFGDRDYVAITNAPIGTFSTGQHGVLGKHRRMSMHHVRSIIDDTPTVRRRALERGLSSSR